MKKIILLLFCLSNQAFAQNDVSANGTFYQTGGKIFEAIDTNDDFYQLNISFDKTKKEYTLRRINPKLPQISDSVIFTKFDSDIVKNRLEKLFSNTIDSLTLSKLVKELNKI